MDESAKRAEDKLDAPSAGQPRGPQSAMRPDLLATELDPSSRVPGDLLFEPYVDSPKGTAPDKPKPAPAFLVESESADGDASGAERATTAESSAANPTAPVEGETAEQRELRLTATLNLKKTGFLGHAQKLILGDEPEPLSSAARVSTGLLVIVGLIGFIILTVLVFVFLFR